MISGASSLHSCLQHYSALRMLCAKKDTAGKEPKQGSKSAVLAFEFGMCWQVLTTVEHAQLECSQQQTGCARQQALWTSLLSQDHLQHVYG